MLLDRASSKAHYDCILRTHSRVNKTRLTFSFRLFALIHCIKSHTDFMVVYHANIPYKTAKCAFPENPTDIIKGRPAIHAAVRETGPETLPYCCLTVMKFGWNPDASFWLHWLPFISYFLCFCILISCICNCCLVYANVQAGKKPILL